MPRLEIALDNHWNFIWIGSRFRIQILISLENSRATIEILQSLFSVRREKSGNGWFLLSNIELESKIVAKSFTLSYVNEIT